MDSVGDGLVVATQNNSSAASTADAPIIDMSTGNSLKKVSVEVLEFLIILLGLVLWKKSVEVLEFLIILLGLWLWKKNRVDKHEDEVVSYTFRDSINVAHKFSYDSLLRATNNFSEQEKLGEGSFGAVYKGFLGELKCYVAVKRMSKGSRQGVKEFSSEVKIVSQLRHRNIVRLMGWCCERKELLLVYEFMPNGSLDSHLFKEESLLPWETRFKIALGLASGLLYLHDGWEQYVVHRDVKASNVMLDSNFNAKLGDFGLARLSEHGEVLLNSSIEGTIGYVAPEYATIGRASKGSDVFSFGSVALEIACGRKVIDGGATEDHINLREWVWDLYGKKTLLDAVDPRLNGEFDKEQVGRLMIVGLWCVHPDANLRPTIEKAIHVLKFVAPLPDLPSEYPIFTIFAPFSASSAGTNRIVSNPSFQTVDNFSRQKKFAKGDLFAIFRGFRMELNFGRRMENFGRLMELNVGRRMENFGRLMELNVGRRMELKFGRRRKTSNREKISKRTLYPLDCNELPSDNCRAFSIAEIRKATNNFEEYMVIGIGGFGKVYKGYIDGGSTPVAIKRCAESSRQGIAEFLTEISMLSKLRHRHVVSLIGYHSDKRELILVYEYMAQGTLRDHLYKTEKPPIPWEHRLKICIGAAKGLHYLHTGTKNTIIHRDIKSNNILLDDKLEAMISDFGISKVRLNAESETNILTVVKGTFGYLDPEYLRTSRLTEKSDVYSFGVVLFEVLCARPAMQMKETNEEERHLALWALLSHRTGALDQIIDPYLRGKISPASLGTFIDIAIKCLADRGKERPSMGDVLYSLELALQKQTAAELEENIALDESERLISDVSGAELPGFSFLSDTQVTLASSLVLTDPYLDR